ncbi:MAG: hypothetical protein ACRD1R_00325 [Acidobacteriota bacterium]
MKRPTLSRREVLHLGTAAAVLPGNLSSSSVQAPSGPLYTRGLFTHVWDLKDQDVDNLLDWMRDSGLNQMCIAGSYHSGWFVHPHSPSHRAYMTEGSVIYFQPDHKIWSRNLIKPHVASFVKENNWLKAAGERIDRYGVRMVSWTIGTHNTTLGKLYPQYTQHNVYGDSIPHALSVGHDATREYLKALCRDLAINYPMYGIQLESFGWMGLKHGHHHERDLTGLSSLEQQLLSMCFNPQTVGKAEAEGIDAGKVKEVVRTVLDAAFQEAPHRPAGHPRSMGELEDQSPELKAYNGFRERLADSMIAELKAEALKGTSCKLLMQGGYRREIAAAVDGFSTGAYGQPPEEVLAIVRQALSAAPPGWEGDFPCFIRLGMGIPESPQQLREIVKAVKEGGSTGPVFYNYSESPSKMLSWIKGALYEL